MLKILFTAAALLAVYFIFFKKKSIGGKKKEGGAQDMVECSRCGVFTSVEDAYIKDGKYYCSKECMQ
ncbi:MAG: PP0621 family protein [Campylobacterota bacterium]